MAKEKQVENPLEKWYKVTQSQDWKKIPEEERNALRQEFVDTYASADEQLRIYFDLGTRPLKEVFETEEFQKLPEAEQLRTIKANKMAMGGLKESDFGKSFGLNKKGDREIARTYRDEYLRPKETVLRSLEKGSIGAFAQIGELVPDTMAGSPILGGAKALSKLYRGGPEKAAEYMRETSNLQARDKGVPLAVPGVYDTGYRVSGADIAEVTPAIASTLVTGPMSAVTSTAGKVVGRNALNQFARQAAPRAAVSGAETAALSPVTTSEGASAEQRQQEIASGKQTAALLGAGGQLAGDIITAPGVKEALGNKLRWLGARLGAAGKRADIADDYLSRVRQEAIDPLKEAANRGETVVGPSQQDLLRSVQTERAALEAGPSVGWTGTSAPSLGKLQLESAGADVNKIAQGIETGARPALDTFATVKPVSMADASEYVQKTYLPPAARTAVVQKDAIVRQENEKLSEAVRNIWGPARQSGVLSTPAGISQKQYMNRLDDALEGLPKKEKDKLKALMTRPKPTKAGLTFDHVVLDKMDLLQAKTPQNTAYIDALVGVQDDILGTSSLPEINSLFQRTAQEEVAAKARIAEATKALDIDNKISTGFAKEPVMKAFARGGDARSVAAGVLDVETDIPQVKKILSDTVLGPKLKTAVLVDISDTLNLKNQETRDVALQKLREKYLGREDVVKEVLGPKLSKDFDTLMSAGLGQGAARKQATEVAESRTLKQGARGATQQLLSLPAQSAAAIVDPLINAFNSETRKMLNQTAYDKKLALQILSKAEDIQKGRITYREAYDRLTGARFAASAGATGVAAAGTEFNNSPTEPVPEMPTAPAEDVSQEPVVDPQAAVQPLTDGQNTGIISTFEDDLDTVGLAPAYAQYAYALTGAESGHSIDTNLPTGIKNPDGTPASSAKGPAQFLDDTWNAMSKIAEKSLGRPLDKNNLNDHLLATALYGKQNYNALKSYGVQSIGPADLYVAHVWGAGDPDNSPSAGYYGLYKNRGRGILIENIWPRSLINKNPSYARPGMTVDEVLAATKKGFKTKVDPKKQARLKEAATNVI